mgnify:CR=1 FL=1
MIFVMRTIVSGGHTIKLTGCIAAIVIWEEKHAG